MINLYIAPEAQKDLFEIKEYISLESEDKEAAIKVIVQITKRIHELLDFPTIGASLETIIDIQTDYRFLVCNKYTIFYRYLDGNVYVDRVLNNRRNFMKVLFQDDLEIKDIEE